MRVANGRCDRPGRIPDGMPEEPVDRGNDYVELMLRRGSERFRKRVYKERKSADFRGEYTGIADA